METTPEEMVFLGDWLPRRELDLRNCLNGGVGVANLECAFSSRPVVSGKAHTAVVGIESIDIVARSGLGGLNLANNHTLDAGAEAMARATSAIRDRCPTQLFGTRDNPFGQWTLGTRTVAVIGCIEKCRSRGRHLMPLEHVTPLIRQLRDHFDRVLVFPHWGKEGEYAGHPSPGQIRTARRWIEAGAAGVVGHHAHGIHGWGQVGTRRVYYCIGNLDFDHPEGSEYPQTRSALLVRVAFGNPADRWSHTLIATGARPGVALEGEELGKASQRLARLSTDLEGPWDCWRWARAVGPIYIRKSRRSWRIRLSRSPVGTLPRYLIWNLLPTNLLLRAGHLLGPCGREA